MKLDISNSSIKRILHDMDFNYGPKLREVELTPREKEVRLTHCIKIGDNYNMNLSRIVFSDESYFKSNY